jgi:hypothetical protein
VGAAIYQSLREYVSKNEALLFGMGWQFYTGAIFIACVLFFPRGVWGTLKHALLGRSAPILEPASQTEVAPEPAAAGVEGDR